MSIEVPTVDDSVGAYLDEVRNHSIYAQNTFSIITIDYLLICHVCQEVLFADDQFRYNFAELMDPKSAFSEKSSDSAEQKQKLKEKGKMSIKKNEGLNYRFRPRTLPPACFV